ncbi:MAG: hypothetical protein U5M51_02445 [Emticicia sp.]|nr:hypothetical protein [Emticicia sp.]
MRIINQIPDITHFTTLRDTCFYYDEFEFGKIENGIKKTILKSEHKFYFRFADTSKYILFHQYRQKINLFYDILCDTFVDDLFDEKFKQGMCSFGDFNKSDGKYMCLVNQYTPETVLFDLEKKEVIWSQNRYIGFDIVPSKSENNHKISLLGYNFNETPIIVKYSFNDGNVEWRFEMPPEYDWEEKTYSGKIEFHKCQIVLTLGCFENILWFALNSGILIGLSLETGKIETKFTPPESFPFRTGFSSRHILDEDNGMIFGLSYHYYWELDLKKTPLSMTLFDISETTQKNEMIIRLPQKLPYERNKIFMGDISGWVGNKIGIFDRITKQIVWTAQTNRDPSNCKPAVQKIEYSNNKLYVLDGLNTLIIYEMD